MNIVRRVYLHFLKKHNTVKYATKIGVVVGKGVIIAPSVSFDTEPYLIEIGEGSKITNNVRFVTHDGGAYVIRHLFEEKADLFGRIRIGKYCFIGNNATIMPNVSVGDNVIVGYGSIVTKNIPSNEVWAGIPARYIETVEEYYEKNKDFFLPTKDLSYEQKQRYLIQHYQLNGKQLQ